MTSGIPADWMGLDVGPDSISSFTAVIERSNTVIWNGPVGVFEFENFSKGSRAVLDSICMATEKGATSIIGKLFHLVNVILLLLNNIVVVV